MSLNKSFGDFNTLAGDIGKTKTQSFPDGCRLGEYRIIRLLGRGGMGEVYEVEHSTLCRRYALKVLPADFAAMPGAVDRFRREARVMANLEHPNILKVDEFGEVCARYWLRMELVKGSSGVLKCGSSGVVNQEIVTLADLANLSGGRIDQVDFAPILRQILEAMTYAHSRGVVHRDLKPSNILLEGRNESAKRRIGESEIEDSKTDDPASLRTTPWQASDFLVKISDFGLVRLVGEEWIRNQVEISVKHSMTMGDMRTIGAGSQGASTKSLIGTYEYMSPEQKRGEDADKRSDVYALGLMCYRLLTGKNISPRQPSYYAKEISKKWDDFILKSLEENAGERYADAGEMLEDFRGINSLTTETQRHQGISDIPARASESSKNKPGLSAPSDRSDKSENLPLKSRKTKLFIAVTVILTLAVLFFWRLSSDQKQKAEAERIARQKNEQLQQEADRKRQDDDARKKAEEAKTKEDQRKQLENANRKVEVKERNDTISEISNFKKNGSGPVVSSDWTVPDLGMEFVWIKALNCWAGKYEVTNGEYRKFKEDHDSNSFENNSLNSNRQPVVYVNFDDATEYAKWLTTQERKAGRLPSGYSYRLPTKDEWTTFCQCGDSREYPWGNGMPPKYGNYSGQESAWSDKIDGYNDGFPVTCPVEKSGKNDWGLYGVGGNVWECTVNSSSDLSFDAWRGASWSIFSPGALRLAHRDDYGASERLDSRGFRLLLSR